MRTNAATGGPEPATPTLRTAATIVVPPEITIVAASSIAIATATATVSRPLGRWRC
ncbi:MAG: hypothetical protein NTV52_20205 [Acidobacteria bacterium]|nr:hypothetical protein [Acidobacteriota bacterium]